MLSSLKEDGVEQSGDMFLLLILQDPTIDKHVTKEYMTICDLYVDDPLLVMTVRLLLLATLFVLVWQ